MRNSRRAGYTLFQLLLLLALVLLLLGMLFPALHKVQIGSKLMTSQNNLKMLGLALHSYNDAQTRLPPGVDARHFSATAKLLPYIEQDSVYRGLDLNKNIDDPDNAKMRAVRIKVLESPRDPIEQVSTKWGATNYLFNDKVFFLDSKATIPASFPDGTSNTIVTGETLKGDGGTKAVTVQRQHVLLGKEALKGIKPDAGVTPWKDGKSIVGDRCSSWMDGRFLQGTFNGAFRLNDSRPDVSCAGAGGVSTLRSLDDIVLVGLGDGSVRTVSAKRLSLATWQNALDPADGNVLGSDW